MTDNLRHLRRFLRINNYPIPTDDRDVVHTVRAIIRHQLKEQGLPHDDEAVNAKLDKLESK